MKNFVAWILCVTAVTPLAATAQEHCSRQTLKGQYIFTGRGYIEPGDPNIQREHSGILVFDGVGSVSGKQSSTRGGKIRRDEKLQGTYEINADCTGTATFNSVATPGGQIHWDVYITQDGKTGHMIRTDEGSWATRSFQK